MQNTLSTRAISVIKSKLSSYLAGVFCLEPQREIAVLLSGGVDSSVVLACLKEFGCQNIRAYYLKIWLQDDAQFLGDCPWEEDLDYATAVCEYLDLPLQVLPMQEEYYRYVVEYTLSELRIGRTPSPDVFCNQFIKFEAFHNYLQQRYEKAGKEVHDLLIATGHYALLEPVKWLMAQEKSLLSHVAPVVVGRNQEFVQQEVIMRQAPDPVKDQSYFLSRLSQEQLQHLIFPLGCLIKSEVRELAKFWDLPTARRKDSQGICFLGKVKFRDFACHYLGEQAGPIVNINAIGEAGVAVLGTHRGLWLYTIGQRQGLGLAGGPWYVYGKNMQTNTLYVQHLDMQEKLERQVFWVEQPSWLQSAAAREYVQQRYPSSSLALKLRHGSLKIACRLEPVEPMEPSAVTSQGLWLVSMEKGDRGVAAGQFAVFYWGDICLGNASIMHSEFSKAIGS